MGVRARLGLVFGIVLAVMLWVTARASLHRSVFVAGAELWSDPWGRATLVDAYFGFLAFFCWVAYRERTLLAKLIWGALLLGLGNIAIAIYMLLVLRRLPAGATAEDVLLRPRP